MTATARLWAVLNDKVGSRCYRLPIGALLELKERTGLTPPQLFKLLTDDTDDNFDEIDLVEYSKITLAVCTIIEVALYWGGSTRAEAAEIVDRWCKAPNRGLGSPEALPLAVQLLHAALSPPADEPFPPAKIHAGSPAIDDESFPFAPYYTLAGAMGLAPSEILNMAIWELAHFQKGWKEANGIEEPGVTREEFDKLGDMIDNFEPIVEEAQTSDGD